MLHARVCMNDMSGRLSPHPSKRAWPISWCTRCGTNATAEAVEGRMDRTLSTRCSSLYHAAFMAPWRHGTIAALGARDTRVPAHEHMWYRATGFVVWVLFSFFTLY